MNKGYVGVVAGALAGLAVGVGIDSWGGNAGHDEPIAKAQQEVVSSRDVKLSAELAKRGQLATEKVEKRALAPTLKLVGSVNFDSDAVADVGGRIDGRITRMLVSIGDKVDQGQALVEIESNQLGEAMATLLSARANSDRRRESRPARDRPRCQAALECSHRRARQGRSQGVARRGPRCRTASVGHGAHGAGPGRPGQRQWPAPHHAACSHRG